MLERAEVVFPVRVGLLSGALEDEHRVLADHGLDQRRTAEIRFLA